MRPERQADDGLDPAAAASVLIVRAPTRDSGQGTAGPAVPAERSADAAFESAFESMVAQLTAEGLTIERVTDGAAALESAHARRPALVIVCQRAVESGGLAILESIHRQWSWLPVLLLAERPAVTEAVLAMQAGAAWYGPFGAGPDFGRAVRSVLDRPLTRAPEQDPLSSFLARGTGARGGIVGKSEAIRRVLKQAALVSPTRTTVLLLGETGTGKERLAQAIHESSPRRRGPFVAVNCAALAETLLESELFGHEKGAFSGAHSRREGRFELAHGGTIFLDEVGEISLQTQVKLLRVLQERRFERAGGNQTVNVDVRIVAATNRNLRDMVTQKTFRADLFYRLNVMSIEVPPLRARRGDIPLLVEHLLPRLVVELGLPAASSVTPAALEVLMAHDWPGNVRELENVLQAALVLSQGRPIGVADLPDLEIAAPGSGGPSPGAPTVPGASFREIERHVIMTTYEACGRSPLRTAEVLGISPRTVHYRLREYRGERGRRLLRKDEERAEEEAAWTAHGVRSDAPGAGPAETER